MNKLSSVILAFLTLFFISCTEEVEVEELSFTKRVDGASSTAAFRNTVHPILLKRCSGCHGDAGPNLKHSASDYKVAHDKVVDGGKVDFGNPANSRLVDKLISQRHNCWDGDCQKSADEMLAAINKWIELRGNQDTLKGAKTPALKYKDAIRRAPETINGVLVLQAEDGQISGRFQKKTSSSASGYAYIAGNFPKRHPIEQTTRTLTINTVNVDGVNWNSACDSNNPAFLNTSPTEGMVRIREAERHPDQSGYLFYSQQVRYSLIHPKYRSAYLTALQTDAPINPGWYLRTGAIGEDGFNSGDGFSGSIRVLPEFRDHAYYTGTILTANSESPEAVRQFFAPRFGDAGIDYFQATSSEIRENLQSYLKRSHVRKFVQNTFKKMFFTSASGNLPVTNLNSTPYTLLQKPGAGDSVVTFAPNDAALSDEFLTYYRGDITDANALDVLGCTSNGVYNSDSDTCSAGHKIYRIDTYVNFSMDPSQRAINTDFSWTYKPTKDAAEITRTFDLQQGDTVNLSLDKMLLAGGTVDKRSITENNYGTILKPLLRNNCASCHADGGGNRPSFANNNNAVAFSAINGRVNFSTPASSRIATRMDEGHNCGSPASCLQIKNNMVELINDWKAADERDIAAAEASLSAPELKSLPDYERTPGRARYNFHVTEDGDYNIWFKAMARQDRDTIRLQVRSAETNQVVKFCNQNEECNNADSSCRTYTLPTHSVWTWVTPGIDRESGRITNPNNKIKWQLEKGDYYLDIFEVDVDMKLDMIAISNNDEFNPRRNLIDEGIVSSIDPRILRYDISSILKSPGFFEIEIQEKNGGDSYKFRNPRFVGNKANIRVQNIKILINDKYEFNDSAYTKISQVVGTQKTNLTYAPLLALSINGLGNDSFSFVFEDLKITDLKETVPEDDIPVAINGRSCKELTLFKRTVKPILTQIRLMRKGDDGYLDHVEDIRNYPGTRRDNGSNPTFYTCTTCHNEQHPYFKMTTFFGDEGSDQLLCDQALSRVDFKNFEKSLMIRGLNGTFNHPKLHFAESVPLNSSNFDGNRSLNFQKDSTKVNGLKSTWAGARFERYTINTQTRIDFDNDKMLPHGDNFNHADSDNDGIPNQFDDDIDGDGKFDYGRDTYNDYVAAGNTPGENDNDNDGQLDTPPEGGWDNEVVPITTGPAGDADGDTIPDELDTDADNDGIQDRPDQDWDNDGKVDFSTPDDAIEIVKDSVTYDLLKDNDADGILDVAPAGGWDSDVTLSSDPWVTDADNDGIQDRPDPDWDNDGWLDAKDLDDNNNGVEDRFEYAINVNQRIIDSNGQEVDRFNGDQKAYLRKFKDQYVRTVYTRINDPYSTRRGDIMLCKDNSFPCLDSADEYDPESELLDKWTYAENGRNMVYVMNPANYATRAENQRPNPNSPSSGGIIKVKSGCEGVNMNSNDGILTDPCNSGEVVDGEFEDIKTRYRNAVINWMKAEARAAGQY